MSFNPANFAAVNSPAAQRQERAAAPAPSATASMVQALEQAAARYALRRDTFAQGKEQTCLDMAAKLEHFGSFVSEKQEGFAKKLIEWSLPRQYSAVIEATVPSPTAPAPAPRLILPKLIALMQRLAKLRIGKLTISRKNGESYCWIKQEGQERVVGKIEGNGTFNLFQRPGVDQTALLAALLDIEKDPEAAAVLHGKASGNCSICGRDLTDPESIARGIGPICAGKFSF